MLPFLNPTNKKSKKYVVAFKGLNYGEGYEDGEFSETKNISLDESPCVTQRSGREQATRIEGVRDGADCMLYKGGEYGGLFVVSDYRIIRYDSTNNIPLWEKQLEGDERREMVGIGNYVCIFPDKLYYNVTTGECKSMQIEISGQMTFANNSITLTEENKEFTFSKGDSVEITASGGHAENNRSAIIRECEPNKLTFNDNTFTADETARHVVIKRTIPDLRCVCESNYRLWGVEGNTIYGSKYMDPLNFQSFDGTAADSYSIDVSTDGEFTGSIQYASHICFFKENVLHKLYGTKPANFQLVTSQVNGVQRNSNRSMCIANDTLYYKGVNGVYAYTGGVPELVSGKLGMKRYGNACAATDGSKYYIAMCGDSGNCVYVYDIRKNVWVHEDDFPCVDMVFANALYHDGKNYIFMLTRDSVWVVKGYEDQYQYQCLPIEWSVTFCPFNETVNERKGYSKFHLRFDLSAGAWLQVEIKRNTDTKWQTVYTTHSDREKTISVPILPTRCDSVEVRLSGKGECKLRTFIREFYLGSDV